MKLSNIENDIIKDLSKLGLTFKDLNEVAKKKKLQPEPVNVILKWLPKLYANKEYGLADILVRSLIFATDAFDPQILISLFDEANLNTSLKYGIGIALAHSKTTDISNWMRNQLLSRDYSFAKHALLGGLNNKGRFSNEKELVNFLKKIFDKYHDTEVLKLFKKFGSEEDIKFLMQKIDAGVENCEDVELKAAIQEDNLKFKNVFKTTRNIQKEREDNEKEIRKVIAAIKKNG